MKNKILLFFLGCSSLILVHSQTSTEIGITVGAEISFPSSFNKDVVKQYESIASFNVGFRIRHNFGVGSFVWGLEYAQMRFIFHNEPNSDPFFYYPEKMSLIADQFRLPLLFQINVGKKKSQFFANTGPCILFGIPRYPDRSEITFGDNESTQFYPSELVKDINIGLMTGVGYSYRPTAWLRIFSEVRFMLPFFANDNIRTLGLNWSLGVSFKTSKQ